MTPTHACTDVDQNRTITESEAITAASSALADAETACGVAAGELLLIVPPDRYSHEDGAVPGDAKVRER
jgi:hypothetical protein